jgi:K+-transporting ATPase ATPase C chain
MVVFTVLFGVVFPLVVTGVGQVALSGKANGSLVERDGRKVGSSLLGQSFTDAKGKPLPQYFQTRPSAVDDDAALSSASNYGPSNPEYLQLVEERVEAYRELNGLSANTRVPVDAVTASGSGLDPDISVANARLQIARVARERELPARTVRRLVADHTHGRTLGVLGEETVDVLGLNLALDRVQQ